LGISSIASALTEYVRFHPTDFLKSERISIVLFLAVLLIIEAFEVASILEEMWLKET
jgi:hypothetical protein